MPATHDQAVIRASVLMVQATVRLIQALKRDIELCDERIEELTKSHPDFTIFDSLPGAGKCSDTSIDRRAGNAARTFRERKRDSVIYRCRSRCETKWQHAIDPLSAGLSSVSAPNIP